MFGFEGTWSKEVLLKDRAFFGCCSCLSQREVFFYENQMDFCPIIMKVLNNYKKIQNSDEKSDSCKGVKVMVR